MAISKTIKLPGGFQASAYVFIRSVRFDRLTGGAEVCIWFFQNETERRAYSEALENLKIAETRANAPYGDLEGEAQQKEALNRMRARRAAEEAFQDCNAGALYGTLQMSPIDIAPAVKDGGVDLAALYDILKKGSLIGGKDILDQGPAASGGGKGGGKARA